jgi:hypothetical protein
MISPREARELKRQLEASPDGVRRGEPLSVEQQADMLELLEDGAIVPSSSRLNLVHHVFLNPKTGRVECTCEDFLYSLHKDTHKCRHIVAFETRKRIDDEPAQACEWCENPDRVPVPNAPQCAEHRALNVDFGRRLRNDLLERLAAVHVETLALGLAIAESKKSLRAA